MHKSQPTVTLHRGEVYLVETSASGREVTSSVLHHAGYDVVCFVDGDGVLSALRRTSPQCVLLDMSADGREIQILDKLKSLGHPSPTVVLSEYGTIATAVDAMKHGALDFIEKPYKNDELIRRVEQTIAAANSQMPKALPVELSPRNRPLTNREREILRMIYFGYRNKNIAALLQISHRTVEDHRATLMRKLNAKSIADLIRLIANDGPNSLVGMT